MKQVTISIIVIVCGIAFGRLLSNYYTKRNQQLNKELNFKYMILGGDIYRNVIIQEKQKNRDSLKKTDSIFRVDALKTFKEIKEY